MTIGRNYDRLVVLTEEAGLKPAILPCPGELELAGVKITCAPAGEIVTTVDTFTVCPRGQMRVTSRLPGDAIRLPGGTKSLKKCFIDRKIPASQRPNIPVIRDDEGILAVYSIGVNQARLPKTLPAVTIRFEEII